MPGCSYSFAASLGMLSHALSPAVPQSHNLQEMVWLVANPMSQRLLHGQVSVPSSGRIGPAAGGQAAADMNSNL